MQSGHIFNENYTDAVNDMTLLIPAKVNTSVVTFYYIGINIKFPFYSKNHSTVPVCLTFCIHKKGVPACFNIFPVPIGARGNILLAIIELHN